MSRLLSLAEPVDPVLATTPGATVYQRIEREPDVMALAVVDEAGRWASAERDDVYVRIRAEVADIGPGVEDERLPHIFDPFVQEDVGRAKGGTGLGLAICRELVERMDGAIAARHTPGGGLTVAFDITAFHAPGRLTRSASSHPPPEAPNEGGWG